MIAVKENRNCMKNDLCKLGFGAGKHLRHKLFVVDNYLEAVGVMAALRAGVCLVFFLDLFAGHWGRLGLFVKEWKRLSMRR